MTQWSIAPVVDWLMHKGRHLPSPEWPGLGRFELPGVEAPMEILALP